MEGTERQINKQKIEAILFNSLKRAAKSMTFFTKREVVLVDDSIDIHTSYSHYQEITSSKTGELFVLKTKVFGDFTGASYLILDENIVELILKANFSDSMLEDKDGLDELTDGILLEMDNIVVASAITEFANKLECKVFGDVPGLNRMDCGHLEQYLKQERKNAQYCLYFNSQLKIDGSTIAPDFVWFLDEQYLKFVETK